MKTKFDAFSSIAGVFVKKISLCFIFGAVGLVSFTNAGALPLTNLGFETPVAGSGTIVYNPVTSDWVFSGLSGLTGNASGFTSGNPVAPEGVQVAFLQSATGYTGDSISQVFTTALDANMSFTFSAAQRAPSNIQSMNLLLDSVLIGSFTPTGVTYLDYVSSLVGVLAGTHTLTFVGLNNVGDNTAFIDNLRVSSFSTIVPVPVPGTIVLLMTGLGLLAYRGRRSASVFGV